MQWSRLKIYLLPIIVQEVDRVIEKYLRLIYEIKGNSKNEESITDFMKLRESIRDRIEEIDNFFEDNFENPKALALEKVRTRLKKLLMYDPDYVVKFENDNTEDNNFRRLVFGVKITENKQENNGIKFNDLNYKINDNNFCKNESEAINKISPITNNKNKNSNSNSNLQIPVEISFKEPLHKIKNREVKKINSNRLSSLERIEINSKELKKNRLSEDQKQGNNSTNRNNNLNKQNINQNNSPITQTKNKDLNLNLAQKEEQVFSSFTKYNNAQKENNEEAWEEIYFRIKLTNDEYIFLLQEKAKRIHL